jgi:hypothetical protein
MRAIADRVKVVGMKLARHDLRLPCLKRLPGMRRDRARA